MLNWHLSEDRAAALLSASRAVLKRARYMEGSPAWDMLFRPLAKAVTKALIADQQAVNIQEMSYGSISETNKTKLRKLYSQAEKLNRRT